MSKQQSTKIFDAFSQADDSPDAQVRRHGPRPRHLPPAVPSAWAASISVVRELGAGSTFTIELPLVVGPTR